MSFRKIYVIIFFAVIAVGSSIGYSQKVFAIEWVYPVGDPNSNTVRITQTFMNYLDGKGYHNGVDIGRGRTSNIDYQPNNKTIRSVAHGRVIYIGTGDNYGWGNTIVVRHDFLSSNRYIFSSYSHMEDNSLKVSLNEEVQSGQPIGIMGNTGDSEGIHLHFMVFTTENGQSSWNDFSVGDLGKYLSKSDLPVNYNIGDLITYDQTTFYDPLLFIKFARLAAISPPSVQNYSVNGDSPLHMSTAGDPSPILFSKTNRVEVTVATYRNEISMQFDLRNYSGTSISGDMNLKSRGYSGWIMSSDFNPLGKDCDNGGWNCERELTYSYDFYVSTPDNSGVDLAIFWKPLWYDSTKLILPIPGGVAHNTIENTGRYVHRPVE